MRLLVVEDEAALCASIAEGLCLDGYEVVPGLDGMEVLRRLRADNVETGVLILSARGQLQDKVSGLDAGANDYLTKPFHFEELEARVRSLTRRRFVQENVCLLCGDKITLTTKLGTRTYEVTSVNKISETDNSLLAPLLDSRQTICTNSRLTSIT